MNEQVVWRMLAEVQDPELPVSLVDMGLIYGVRVKGSVVEVDLTFTSTGCPCTAWIKEDICRHLKQHPAISDVRLHTVWDPPWTVARLTDKARKALVEMGVAVD
jgi:metal-sulfur cluster biosynthetic enzyme